jgi:hypothetical protein
MRVEISRFSPALRTSAVPTMRPTPTIELMMP